MPKFKKNPNPIMKKQAFGEAQSPFKMKMKSYGKGKNPIKFFGAVGGAVRGVLGMRNTPLKAFVKSPLKHSEKIIKQNTLKAKRDFLRNQLKVLWVKPIMMVLYF